MNEAEKKVLREIQDILSCFIMGDKNYLQFDKITCDVEFGKLAQSKEVIANYKGKQFTISVKQDNS